MLEERYQQYRVRKEAAQAEKQKDKEMFSEKGILVLCFDATCSSLQFNIRLS